MKLILAISAFLFLLEISCSTTKRSAVPCPDFSHSRNYHSWHAPAGKNNQDFQPQIKAILVSSTIPIIRPNLPSPAQHKIRAENHNRLNRRSEKCDTIVLSGGKLLIAMVIDVGEKEIRYRACENLKGPVFVVNIADVLMIRYPDGSRIAFNSGRRIPSSGATVSKKPHELALGGFFGSIMGIFILGVPLGMMAMILGAVGLRKINNYPERYSGKGFAVLAMIMGFIDVMAAIFILSNML
jgi:hypothetical protein